MHPETKRLGEATMDLEFRESQLLETWHRVNGDKPMPANLLTLKSWECVHDSRVVGHCTADTATGEIVGLSVDHGYRRQGIARKLLSHIVDLLCAQGAGKIWLAVPRDSMLPAHHFYRALGWRPATEHPTGGDEILEFPIRRAASHQGTREP
jgi:ribosomal protein S18 acetylase RimI-like enzyme